MRNQHIEVICKKRLFFLAQSIDVELWLSDMAAKGYMLSKIDRRKWIFRKGESVECRFFLMNPDIGTNSDGWVFYEFERCFGRKIPCVGPYIFSPSRALVSFPPLIDQHSVLIDYYYKYRNYRLIRRFLRSALLSFGVCFVGVILVLFGSFYNNIALLPYIIVSLFLGAYNVLSFFRFRNSCNRQGWSKPLQRPKRPIRVESNSYE